jgi:hypothetical protein
MSNELSNYIGKKVRLFVRGLDVRPILYTSVILNVTETFIHLKDIDGKALLINCKDVIQIKEMA